MAESERLERITDRAVLERHLDALVDSDARLAPVRELCGEIPLRLRPGGFEGLAAIVISQQVSVASARAIQSRFEDVLDEVSAQGFLALPGDELRGCGLSFGKLRTLTAIAEAEAAGQLDYDALAHLPGAEAIAALTGLHGIGPWTAEIYLLFCLGHPDVFPAGDLALQKMVGLAFGEPERPDDRRTRELTAGWSPYRGAAARLMWRHFAVLRDREGIAA
jgi:DNA-3-methyladenine glycosylase II